MLLKLLVIFKRLFFPPKVPAGQILLSGTSLHSDNLQILPLDAFVQSHLLIFLLLAGGQDTVFK